MDENHENVFWIGQIKQLRNAAQQSLTECISKIDSINKQISLGDFTKFGELAALSGLEIQVKALFVAYSASYNFCEKIIANEEHHIEPCLGCKHHNMYDQELEYGISCPCTLCKRRVSDNYESEVKTNGTT